MNFRKTTTIFLSIVIVAFILHLIVFPVTMVGGDEGRYTLDALRIDEGEIPIVDYTTRTPILLFLMFASTKLLGLSLFALRLPVLLFSALTSGVLFLLGKELYSRRVGVFSASIYLLSPMILWGNQVIKSENLTVLLVALSVLLLIKSIKNDKWYWFILSGLPIGIAYIERQSAASFLVTTALVLLWTAWRRKEGFKTFMKFLFSRGTAVFAGFLIGFSPIFLYFFSLNRESAVELWLTLFIVNATLAPTELATGVYEFIRGWSLNFVEDIAIQGWVIYFGAVSFVSLVAKSIFNKTAAMITFLLLSIPFYIHASKVILDWNFAPTIFASVAVGGTLFWFVVTKTFVLKNRDEIEAQYNFASVVILSWLLSVFIVYALFYKPGYDREFLVPLSLASGVVLSAFFSLSSKTYKTLAVLSFVVLWVGGAIWFNDPRTGPWWWEQETVVQASEFIRENTEEGEEIFTASSLPVLYAERRVFKQLNPYAIMLAPDDDTGWGTQPSPNEILRDLENNPPKLVVYDGRMGRNFIRKTNNVELEVFLETNYTPVATFGSGHRQDWIEIWERI